MGTDEAWAFVVEVTGAIPEPPPPHAQAFPQWECLIVTLGDRLARALDYDRRRIALLLDRDRLCAPDATAVAQPRRLALQLALLSASLRDPAGVPRLGRVARLSQQRMAQPTWATPRRRTEKITSLAGVPA